MNRPIVSVHTPKVAGTSFLSQLRSRYGDERVLLDYQDDPTNPLSAVNIDPRFYELNPVVSIAPNQVVHGHFRPAKYAQLASAFRITFLRHPIANVISIYNYWSAQNSEQWDHPIFRYFKEMNLSLLRFASLPAIRYLYTGSYFVNFDMSGFDFIGDHAHYASELDRLSDHLGVEFDSTVHHNATSEFYDDEQAAALMPGALSQLDIAELGKLLARDIAFYDANKGR